MIKVKNVVEIEKGRKSSFWFDGQVAIVSDGKREISVEATGHVEVTFKPDGEAFDNDMARKEALSEGFTDRKLNNLSNHDGWGNNNWFTLYEKKGDKYEWIADTVAYDYEEAIAMAKDKIKEN